MASNLQNFAVPSRLNIKRKASDLPPDTLILPSSKKFAQEEVQIGGTRAIYVLERVQQETSSGVLTEAGQDGNGNIQQRPGLTKHRTFLLNRTAGSNRGRLQARHSSIATFTEARSQTPEAAVARNEEDEVRVTSPDRKRPGKGAVVRNGSSARSESLSHAQQVGIPDAQIAEELHQFAVLEAAKDVKPHIVPKLSGARSAEIHRKRIAANRTAAVPSRLAMQREIAMTDTGTDVYDTYILVPHGQDDAVHTDANITNGNVGYLVIQDEDRDIWETYIDDDSDDNDDDVDEEDENAEGFYGADYPEDELDSDDEFDRNPYSYSNKDEEWDHTADSDDEEYSRMMDPWKMVDKRSLNLRRPTNADDD